MQKMLTLIFANDILETLPDILPDLLERTDRIIAADGGANHCARLGIVPTMLIGDLDSVEAYILQKFQTQGVDIHRHPPEKDETDLDWLSIWRLTERQRRYGCLAHSAADGT